MNLLHIYSKAKKECQLWFFKLYQESFIRDTTSIFSNFFYFNGKKKVVSENQPPRLEGESL